MKLKKIGKVIPLNNNKGYVRVDREDYEYLKQFRWYLFQSEKWKYAIRGESKNGVTKTIFMVRIVSGKTGFLRWKENGQVLLIK